MEKGNIEEIDLDQESDEDIKGNYKFNNVINQQQNRE